MGECKFLILRAMYSEKSPSTHRYSRHMAYPELLE